ncbi:MAG: DUF262 domain-containing protein [Campylobacterota bacterium]|nr:DUF262 domain-containing protein [Campylobacterota bacterium]
MATIDTEEIPEEFDNFSEDELYDKHEIYDITTFGTSADVITIYNRLKKGRYYIPEFQRDYVWNTTQASRLIESIIMGLPIPAIFLAKDDTQEDRYYIIDGQQRLLSIQKYYDGEFALKDTIDSIDGKKYNQLNDKQRNRLDEYTLQLIMIRQEIPDDNNDSIYKIFERINTSGTKLSSQEMRMASYHGEFNKLLDDLTLDNRWKKLIVTTNRRKRHEELILRFLALYFDLNNYVEPIKHFLNVYMSKNRNFQLNSFEEIQNIFNQVFDIVDAHLAKEHICLLNSNRINTQLLESVLVGIAHNLDNKNIVKENFLVNKINQLKRDITNNDFEEKAYWESRRSKAENVKGRCEYLIRLFSEK